jgi:hypothetical protein
MNSDRDDLNRELMLDGNAVAGLLSEVFALEMTACPCQCAHCGAEWNLACVHPRAGRCAALSRLRAGRAADGRDG